MTTRSKNRQNADIEITPGMIKAGQAVYYEWEDNDEPETSVLIEGVLRAALAVSGKESGRD